MFFGLIQVVQMLHSVGASFGSVNVLQHPAIREGVKAYSDWPTIPQLYIDGEFSGGCDIGFSFFFIFCMCPRACVLFNLSPPFELFMVLVILIVTQMFQDGELKSTLEEKGLLEEEEKK